MKLVLEVAGIPSADLKKALETVFEDMALYRNQGEGIVFCNMGDEEVPNVKLTVEETTLKDEGQIRGRLVRLEEGRVGVSSKIPLGHDRLLRSKELRWVLSLPPRG